MGIPVLILGESGSGKSASLRNFEPDEVGIFNVASKPLPFRKQLKKIDGANYNTIAKVLSNPEMKKYVIDDSQYLLCFELFARAKETGFEKFVDLALHFYNLIKLVTEQTPPDVVVYFLHHTELTEGKTKAKTIGKMLDEKLTVDGLFTLVLLARTDGKRYWFETQNDGFSTCKSPMYMFDEREIDNDLKFVDEKIREYWKLNQTESEEK